MHTLLLTLALAADAPGATCAAHAVAAAVQATTVQLSSASGSPTTALLPPAPVAVALRQDGTVEAHTADRVETGDGALVWRTRAVSTPEGVRVTVHVEEVSGQARLVAPDEARAERGDGLSVRSWLIPDACGAGRVAGL